MSESTRCYSSGEVFKNTLWENVFRQQAQVLFDRMNDASGNKVQKKVTENGQTQTTDYLSGFQYLDGKLDFLPHAEGYVKAVHIGSTTEYHYVYNYTDHLGNIRLSYGRDPETGKVAILKESHYYPFGLQHNGFVGTHRTTGVIGGIGVDLSIGLIPVRNYLDDSYHYTFGGKEEQPELGLNWIDHHARNYMPDLGRWMNMDPLAEQTPSWSPYTYAFNNPLRYIDPTGMSNDDVIITGDKLKEAFNQLQSSTSLKLKIDDNGKVTASGKAKTDADKKLLEATTDANVVVQINATSSNFTESEHWYVGGAYEGSTIGEDGKTYTTQTVNPEMTGKIDEFYGMKKGVSVMHEVIESYIGGVESPGVGAPTFDNTTPEFKAYKNAHDKTKTIDSRHRSMNISQDPNTGHLYINKPHPVVPQLNVELLINDLSKKK